MRVKKYGMMVSYKLKKCEWVCDLDELYGKLAGFNVWMDG